MKKQTSIIIIAALALSAWTARSADVAALYEKHCVKCHGADGKGETKMGKKVGAKDLTDAKLQAELKDDQAFKAIKEGLKDKEGKIQMKPIEGATDEEIKSLVGFVRTFKK
jgi:cytochrome c6